MLESLAVERNLEFKNALEVEKTRETHIRRKNKKESSHEGKKKNYLKTIFCLLNVSMELINKTYGHKS